jgi:hypothetical protein
MAEANRLQESNAAFVYRDIPAGTKVKLYNGAVFEVTGNPGDGAWLIGRYLSNPEDPSIVGQDEQMLFFTDVDSLA